MNEFRLIQSKICMTKDVGFHGNLFGGYLLCWLDEAAATYASEVCYTPNIVTLKFNEVIFKNPVKVGMRILIYAKTVKIGKSSITIKLEARKNNHYTHEEEIVCSTEAVFVRIDDEGKSVPISEHVKDKFKESKLKAKPSLGKVDMSKHLQQD
jgi:acyl-CoA thioesterase YciA